METYAAIRTTAYKRKPSFSISFRPYGGDVRKRAFISGTGIRKRPLKMNGRRRLFENLRIVVRGIEREKTNNRR